MELFIHQKGSYLSRKEAMFCVRHQHGEQLLATLDVDSIWLAKGVLVSTDALLLALQSEIPVLLTSHNGQPLGRFWSNHYGSIATIRKKQFWFSLQAQSLIWAKDLVLQKIVQQITFLHQAYAIWLPEQVRKLQKLVKIHQQLDELPTENLSIQVLMGYEGIAAQQYFKKLSALLPEEYQFKKRTKRPAKDAFNATLNYLYGILYGLVEGALIKAGLDPQTGILHQDAYNKPTLAFDMIEKYRIWAEQVAFSLCVQKALLPQAFISYQNGYWLSEVGRRVVIPAFFKFLDKTVPYKQSQKSRRYIIQLEAHELAQFFLKLKI